MNPSLPSLPAISVKTRMTVVVIAIVLATMLVTVAAAHYLLQSGMQATIESEQAARVANIAAAVDHKFRSRAILLRVLAQGLAAVPQRRDAQQAFLASHAALLDAFDNVVIVDRHGELIANYARPQSVGKINIADRSYFSETISKRRAVISAPLRNRTSDEPQVQMTSPVLDSKGDVHYVLVGSINLQESNFLGELSHLNFGKTGYMFIMTTDGIMVDHPHKARLLTSVRDEADKNPATKKALAGFEGSIAGVNSYGVRALYSYHRMTETKWIVGALYPQDEVLAPIASIQRELIAVGLLLALLAGAIAWWSMRRMLAPLLGLHALIRSANENPYADLAPALHRADEIGELGSSFERLTRQHHASRKQLSDSELRTRSILTHAADAFVSMDTRGMITEWNRQAELSFGWKRSEVIGRSLSEVLIPADMRAGHEAGLKRFVATGEGPYVSRRLRLTALHRDGRELPLELTISAVHGEDGYSANAFMRDISERLSSEARLADSEKRLRIDLAERIAAEQKLARSEQALRAVTSHVPALIGHIDSQQRYTFVNEYARRVFGEDVDAIIGKTVLEVRGEAIYAEIGPRLQSALDGEEIMFEHERIAQGRHYHFQSNYVPEVDSEGRVVGVYLMSVDITDRKNSELQREGSERRLRTITDNLPVLISYIDSEHRFQFCNGTYKRWLDLEPERIIGKHMEEVVGAQLYAERRAYIERALRGKVVEFEITTIANGASRHLQTSYIPDRAEDGTITGIYAISTDISRLKEVEKQLIQLARFDTLTGLPNRHQLNEKLSEAIGRSRRSGAALALLYLDIDHFKIINDSLGHAAGDFVLQEFARRLSANVRATDTVARLAGDEFVIIIEDLHGQEELKLVIDKIMRAVRLEWRIENRQLQVTTSIGAAFAEQTKPTPEDLLANADRALYVAKSDGRDTFAIESC